MIVDNNEVRRPERKDSGRPAGWTSLHSWIFLIIVALGVVVIGMQNRYHYLSPLGLGKAYRIDKLFGGIQEYDTSGGWITAQLQQGPPPSMPMTEPPQVGAPPGAMSPRPIPGAPEMPKEQPSASPSAMEPPQAAVAPEPAQPKEETKEERLHAFKQQFPDFGDEEFQLANDDLFPHWKQSVAPNGSWTDFLGVYREFIQWWTDNGSPPEPGFKLWKDFLASKKS